MKRITLLLICFALAVTASNCGELTADYTLDSNVYGSADCFTILEAGVTLDCNGYSIIGDNTINSIAVLNNQDDFTIENCNIQQFKYGVYNAQPTNNQVITNNEVTKNAHLAVYARGTNHLITGNYFYAPRGVYSIGLSDSIIHDNTMISGWTKSSPVSAGILLEYDSSDNLITSNEISDYHEGIAFECPAGCYGNEITGNELRYNTNNALILISTYNTLVTENNITGMGLGAGIQLYSADKTVISDNYLSTPRNLWVKTASASNQIEDNQFYNGADYHIKNNAVTTTFERNYYSDILDYAIYDSNNDGYGDCGQAYPYDSTEPKWLGNGADYQPAGAKRINAPLNRFFIIRKSIRKGDLVWRIPSPLFLSLKW